MEYFEEGEDEPSHRPTPRSGIRVILTSILSILFMMYLAMTNVLLMYLLFNLSMHYGEPQSYLLDIYQFGLAFIKMPTSTNDVGPLMLIACFMELNLLLLFIMHLVYYLDSFYRFLKKHRK